MVDTALANVTAAAKVAIPAIIIVALFGRWIAGKVADYMVRR